MWNDASTHHHDVGAKAIRPLVRTIADNREVMAPASSRPTDCAPRLGLRRAAARLLRPCSRFENSGFPQASVPVLSLIA